MGKSKKNTAAVEFDMNALLSQVNEQADALEAGAVDMAADEEARRKDAEEQALLEALNQATDDAPADHTEPTDPEPVMLPKVAGELKELVSNITPEAAEQKKAEVVAEYEARKDFERQMPGLSSKMIPNLEATEKRLATLGAAAIFCAIDIDPSFINREVSTGSRFNVYALQKVQDIMAALGGAFLTNKINRAIIESMFNFKDAGLAFTGTAALCAVSDKVKADRAIAKHLVRHTVSANTASTQKSSTMVALATLGIVTNSGAKGSEVWHLTDTPQTRRLEEIVRRAA
jgi:hypothetical protein